MFKFSEDTLHAMAAVNIIAGIFDFKLFSDKNGEGRVHYSVAYNNGGEPFIDTYTIQLKDIFRHVQGSRIVYKLVEEVFEGLRQRIKNDPPGETGEWIKSKGTYGPEAIQMEAFRDALMKNLSDLETP